MTERQQVALQLIDVADHLGPSVQADAVRHAAQLLRETSVFIVERGIKIEGVTLSLDEAQRAYPSRRFEEQPILLAVSGVRRILITPDDPVVTITELSPIPF